MIMPLQIGWRSRTRHCAGQSDHLLFGGVWKIFKMPDFPSAEAFENHKDFENAVCVILDINLNDRSGIELRHRLKVDEISVPIIYMTGNDNPAIVRLRFNPIASPISQSCSRRSRLSSHLRELRADETNHRAGAKALAALAHIVWDLFGDRPSAQIGSVFNFEHGRLEWWRERDWGRTFSA
jgi:hypothetical protein